MTTDFNLECHGSVAILTPNHPIAQKWVDENLAEHQTWCNGVVVEDNYVSILYQAIVSEGFTIKVTHD